MLDSEKSKKGLIMRMRCYKNEQMRAGKVYGEAVKQTERAGKHLVLTPPPLPLIVAKAGRNQSNEKNTPSSPLVQANDIAKPYQIYVKQRSCADVNSPYKRKLN
jgi:hypothetical protein